jgi:hypothetical protein
MDMDMREIGNLVEILDAGRVFLGEFGKCCRYALDIPEKLDKDKSSRLKTESDKLHAIYLTNCKACPEALGRYIRVIKNDFDTIVSTLDSSDAHHAKQDLVFAVPLMRKEIGFLEERLGIVRGETNGKMEKKENRDKKKRARRFVVNVLSRAFSRIAVRRI